MPIKQKRSHHKGKPNEKHTKRFLKAYAPYLPLIVIVGFGLFLSLSSNFQKLHGNVLAYSVNMTDSGLLDATNKSRAENGVAPLKYNVILDEAAQSKAEDMAKRDYWSHNTPDGKEPWVFIDSSGYKYFKAAENLAYGFEDSNSAIIGWMNSPAHRANLLDPDLKEVGFGIINIQNYQNKGPETLVVAMYGLPTPASDPKAAAATNGSEISLPPPSSLATTSEPSGSKKISYAQMLTGGSAPWITFAIGVSIGLMLMYLFLKYTRNFVRALRSGERFILHHPLFDATIVAMLALATIVAQTAGVIH